MGISEASEAGPIAPLEDVRRSMVLKEVKRRLIRVLGSDRQRFEDLKQQPVNVSSLASCQALGQVGRDDFPLQRGPEVLMEATFKGISGQAFTSSPGSFHGTLETVLELPLDSDYHRAVFVATMNAVLRYLGHTGETVHCRDQGPANCKALLRERTENGENMGTIGLVGLQPALLEALVDALGAERVMISDLREAGKTRCGVVIADGSDPRAIFERCQMILITGSTLVNGTIDLLLELAEKHESRIVFYGTTVAGAAFLMGWDRWCPSST